MSQLLKPTPCPSGLDVPDSDFAHTEIRRDVSGHFSIRESALNIADLIVAQFGARDLRGQSKSDGLMRVFSMRYCLKIIDAIVSWIAVNVVDLKAIRNRPFERLVDEPMKVFHAALSVDSKLELRVSLGVYLQYFARKVLGSTEIRYKKAAIRNVFKNFFHGSCYMHRTTGRQAVLGCFFGTDAH